MHDHPSAERLGKLIDFLGKRGIKWQGASDNATPAQFSALLAQCTDRPDFAQIEIMVLRSMSQAIYIPENRGHFGLALEHYAHFTSPIRRYPDLLVHRAIRHQLQGGTRDNYRYSAESMVEKGKHCSMTERRADEATRDAMDFLKCEFMSHRIGETFSGRIANITNFGLFITLDDIYIDGLVHVSALTNDYYHYNAETFTLNGERSGTRFALMDAVEIQVAKVDIEERKIDFELLVHKGKVLQENSKSKKPAKKVAKAITAKAEKAADKKTAKTATKKSAGAPLTKAEKREKAAQNKTEKTATSKKTAKSAKAKTAKKTKSVASTTTTKTRKAKKS